MDNGVYELIVMAAILMAISWVISTAGYALKYANFKIERKEMKFASYKDYLIRKSLY